MSLLLDRMPKMPGLGRSCGMLFVLCVAATAQQPSLRIASPVDGAVVSSGQTLFVTVEAPTGAFQAVSVIGQAPIGVAGPLNAPPYQFALPIPANANSGTRSLTAIGMTADGQPVESEIEVDIERPDPPVSIKNEMSVLLVNNIGHTSRLQVTGTFADGPLVSLTYSSLTMYASSNPAVATVSSTGVVTAVGPGLANITITNAGISTVVPVRVPQPVTVLPSPISLNPSATEQFEAHLALPDGSDPTVTWSIHPALGSIDGTGLYTAPSAVDSEKRVVVTATNVADPTKSGSADVVLLPAVSVSVDPASTTLSAGSTQNFTATVLNALDPTVTWSMTPAGVGALDQSGYYTSPGNIASPQTVTVTATSEADNSKTASSQVTLVPSIALTAGPASVTLYASQTQQFSVNLNYSSTYIGPTWSLNPNVGTIDRYGLYTAPALITAQQTVTVTATTGEGYTTTATITLMPRVSSSITPPSALTASVVSATEIDLSWTASSEDGGTIAGYCIFRNGTPVGTGTATSYSSYSDLGLVSSTTYVYTVVAYDTLGTISAPSASVSAATLAGSPVPGLVASYNMDEGSGTVVHDSSGNGNNGVITGATWTTAGRLTNALQFSGSNSWVTVPDSSSLDLTTGLTLEAWVNAAGPLGWQAVIVKEQDRDLCYGLFANNTWPAANLFAGGEQPVYGNQHIAWAGWSHLAVTYDGANENLYLNGVLVGSAPVSGSLATSSQPLRIGGDGVWGQYFRGMIEEVRIYNRALSVGEIQTEMRGVSVTVSPASVTLYASQGQPFTAAVANISSNTNNAVTWSMSPSLGTLDASGLYTAPAIIASEQTVTVTATSQYDPTAAGTATITLEPQISGSVSAPQGLTATTVSCSAVNLSWAGPTGSVAGYYILRNGTLVGTSATTAYSDLGLVLSTPYTYTVVAYDAQGYVSAPSASATASTLSGTVAPGLVASYDFGEGAGTILHDASCNGNNGVITGAAWSSSGMSGGALVFNGSSNWVEVPDSSSLDLTTGMTVEAWVNPASLSGDNAVLVKSPALPEDYGIYANSSLTGTPAGVLYFGGTSGSGAVFGNAGLVLNAWTHLAATYDGATAKLFVNGVQVGGETYAGPIDNEGAAPPLRIGSSSGTLGHYFDGMIDGVRIYNRALSPAEVLTDMQLPAANITVSPANVELAASGTQQFTSNTAVTWSLSPAVGAIDASGFYVAPAIVGSGQTVTVTATSQVNSTAQASATITLVSQVSDSLPAPQGLTATPVSPSEIDLSWDIPAGSGSSVAGYLIFRNGTVIGTSATSAYSDVAVACGASYAYTVASYDSLGNNSAQSASATANASLGSAVPGLVAYYNFNEGAGTVVHDCSGNGNDGVTNATGWSNSGRWGGSLAFDHSNWVTVPDTSSLELTTGMTLEAWVNPTYLSGALYVVGKAQQADLGDVQKDDYEVSVNSAPGTTSISLGMGLGLLGVAGAANVPLSTWTHLAVTYDGATVNSFVNGTLVNATAMQAGAIRTSANALCIGCGGLGSLLAGLMDDVRIYNRALSQAEIQSDMQNAANVFVSPASVTLFPAQTQQFRSAVTKTGNTGVVWSLSPTLGTIDASGLYTAPADVETQQTVTVTATSQADATRTATAQVTLSPAVTVSISPLGSTLNPSQGQEFTATSSAPLSGVTWSLSPNVGTLVNPQSFSAWYVAPASIAAQQTVTVTATGQADTTKPATAQITLMPPVAVSISPAASVVYPSQTQQFRATVTNTPNTAVTWWVGVGMIDGTGLYTAPATNATVQTVTVWATSQSDYNKSANATITLMPLGSGSISVPGGLTATAVSASEVDLSWTASGEAGGSIAGYNILRNGIPIGTSSTSSYSDHGLIASTTYVYTVAAYDAQGNSSALAASASATTRPGNPNLVTYYNFNEGAGTVANDSSGNGNNGIITDAAWTASGKAGSALTFNGTSSWVEVPDSSTLDLTTGMTLEAWVNMAPSSSEDGWVDILVKEQDQQICYGLFSTSSADWPAGDLFVGGEQLIYGPSQVPLNTWTHLATTYDGTTHSLYVNGVLVASRPQAGAIATAANPLHIGGDSIWGEYFNGVIDEVRIYNRALSQVEIQGDMQTAVSVAVSPATATLSSSSTQQFAAAVAGSGNTAVNWSVALGSDAPAGAQPGAVSAAGMYTPPPSISVQYTVIVTAQSQADTSRSGSAVVTLIPGTRAVAPSFSPAGGTYTAAQTVTLSTTTSGGSIRYTTDGSTPSDTAGTLYAEPITVSGTRTVQAVAYASGLTKSTVSMATYTIRAVAPSFGPAGGTYTATQTVALSTTTSGASIRYTTDGSTPSDTAGTLYAGPITVSGTTTVQAVAYASGLTNSTVSAATYTIRAVAPGFNPAGGTYTAPQTVTLSTATSGASIRYTTDGSTPSDTAGTLYAGPITVSGTTTVQAVAFASGLTNSTVSTATYTIRAVAPSFSPAGGTYTAPQTVSLSTTTGGASIRYTTDGSTPSDTAGTVYTGPITISGTTTVQAVAYASGLTNSSVSAATYTIRAAAPSFSPAGGTYTASQTVSLSTTTSGASIRYTMDGSTPSNTAGTLYGGPITISGTATVQAVAYGSGLTNSTVSTATYTIRAAAPGFSPAGGTYTSAQTVALSTSTSGASIRYTTDGSTPSNTAGTLYAGPITVSGTATVQAVAYGSGLTNSTVSTATYTIRAVAPGFSPAGGTYTSAQTVGLSTTTSGASIRYTTDGSTPSNTAGTLYAGPITVSGTTTVQAVAYASGLTSSTVSTATYTIRAVAPSFSPAGGTYTGPQTVTLSTSTSGASIRYTTDGSTPSDTAGTLYAGPITMSATSTVKAIAFKSGLTNSTVSTATYTIR